MENKIRSTLNEIYFGKTKDIVNGLRYCCISSLHHGIMFSSTALPVSSSDDRCCLTSCVCLNPVSDYLSLLLLPLVSAAFRLLFTTPAPSLCLEMDARYWRCVKLINCRSLEALLQSVVQITNTVGNWGLAVFHPNFNEWLTGALYFRTCDITEDPSENPQCNIRHNLMCIFLVM